jgi:hypothetical protein
VSLPRHQQPSAAFPQFGQHDRPDRILGRPGGDPEQRTQNSAR